MSWLRLQWHDFWRDFHTAEAWACLHHKDHAGADRHFRAAVRHLRATHPTQEADK